ncbi:MAG: GNAT family N-acetyltransferase [Roseburia sp.]|nr:GNAT family N-acetyltransferase [Roseburia sp.]MCM1243123.1 GNAT family N-acetyltransferase [Roseburia sp.]
METFEFKWTNSNDEDFKKFYLITEEYYSRIVGGLENRRAFVPYNISDSIQDVVIAYKDNKAAGCAGLKAYSPTDAEVKRVWVEPDYRGQRLATKLMECIEAKAKEQNFQRTILQTREIMQDAVSLYRKLGYQQIADYPPYDKLAGAVCFAKNLCQKS